MADKEDISTSPVGAALRRNLKRIREAQRLTYVELSKRLAEAERPIPVLGLRRIEKGDRKIDVDDLLALAHVLQVHPVDLLVPGDVSNDQPYTVTPALTSTAGRVREWIAGRGFLVNPEGMSELAEGIRFMPSDRARDFMREWWTPERELEQNRQVNRFLDREALANRKDQGDDG